MNKKIEVVLKFEDEDKVRDLMEDSLIEVGVNRINEFEKEERVYI